MSIQLNMMPVVPPKNVGFGPLPGLLWSVKVEKILKGQGASGGGAKINFGLAALVSCRVGEQNATPYSNDALRV